MNSRITRFEGKSKLEYIYFQKFENNKYNDEEFWIQPDMVIGENGFGAPKYKLQQLLKPGENETGAPELPIALGPNGMPTADIRFSLLHNKLHSPINAAGSCVLFPSFMHKKKMRTDDLKYNIEAGFFAAMNMVDKRVEFRYIPLTNLKLGDQ